MRAEEFDLYPIVHGGKAYNLVTPLDLTFVEVRAIIDWLEERGAFSPDPDEDNLGPGKMFTVKLPGADYDVDVQANELVVYRRTPA